MRRGPVTAQLLVLGASLVFVPFALAADRLALELVADAVPALSLTTVDGSATVDSAALAGRTLVLHFWATWCVPCRHELPALQTLAASLDAARTTVLLVAIDTEASADAIGAYARDLGVTLPIYLARASRLPDSFWGWGLPVTYLIDGAGRFIGRARGPRAWADPAVIESVQRLAGS